MVDYKEFLENKIFKVDKQASFTIMFEMFDLISNYSEKSIILERSYIYAGKSIFSGLLDNECDIIDYRPYMSSEKKDFQSEWISNTAYQFDMAKSTIIEDESSIISKDLESNATILIIPNVLHHCRDLQITLKKILDNCTNINKIFIFDSYLRESHQNPDDYCRYTISALDYILKKFNYKRFYKKEFGNIFDAMLYLFDQARENLNKNAELKDIDIAIESLKLKLIPIRNTIKYRNLGRPYASMETSYSLGYSLNE